MSSSNQYDIHNGEVTWDPMSAFPDIYSCISGYQYSVNGENITNVTTNYFNISSSFTDDDICAMIILTIRPIVAAGKSILDNINLTGPTCTRGNDLC